MTAAELNSMSGDGSTLPRLPSFDERVPAMLRQPSVRARNFIRQSKRAMKRLAGKSKAPPAKAIQEHPHFHWIICGALVLCFNAGIVNAVTLRTAHGGPSAHVTGMVSKASLALAGHNIGPFRVHIISYFSFILGAFISGSVVSYESFYLGRNYGRALLLVTNVLLLALIIQDILPETEMFLYCCCMACGLQNGLMSKYSGNAIRTTHLTGTTTDFSISMAHILKGRPNEVYKVKIHVTCILGFFAGGYTGYFCFERWREDALLVCVTLTLCAGMAHTLYLAYHENVSLIQVLVSKTDFRIRRRSQQTRPSPLRPIPSETYLTYSNVTRSVSTDSGRQYPWAPDVFRHGSMEEGRESGEGSRGAEESKQAPSSPEGVELGPHPLTPPSMRGRAHGVFGDGRSLFGEGRRALRSPVGLELEEGNTVPVVEGVARVESGESVEPTPEEMPQSDFVEGDVAKEEEEEEAEECGGYVDFGMSPRRMFSFRS